MNVSEPDGSHDLVSIFIMFVLFIIQVAKQVRTVPARGCDAEKVLVLRSVISETVLPPIPTPHPDTSENVGKKYKTIVKT